MRMHWYAMVVAVLRLGDPASVEALAVEPAKRTAPSLSDVLTSSGFTESGYVAASYYHSNGYSTFTNSTSSTIPSNWTK
jgi:hypothetical protein